MTEIRHNIIKVTSPQSLVPPPETVTMKNRHTVKTTGDQWQLLPYGFTHTLNFSRLKDICTPAFVNGLQWACYSRLSKVLSTTAYNDFNELSRYLDGLFRQKSGPIDILFECDMLNLKSANRLLKNTVNKLGKYGPLWYSPAHI